MDSDESEIIKFYDDCTILITGATGFLGHVLVSKLLSSCSGIKKIYMLIRGKKNESVEDRFEKYFDDPVFVLLKEKAPEMLEKVVLIKGDCLKPNLGISAEERDILINEVNVVFHSAATVRFDEPLGNAISLNVRATYDLLRLAENMKHLKVFLHISTAFSNCVGRDKIEEKFYKAPISARKLIMLFEVLDTKTLDSITEKLLGDYPNTYVYTKAVAEDACREKSSTLPVAVFRPAIVISTATEPVPGWINNTNGPTGLIAGVAKGFIRSINSCNSCTANVVPCDYVINAVIVSAWKTAVTWKKNSVEDDEHDIEENNGLGYYEDNIYNYSSDLFNWGSFTKWNKLAEKRIPFSESVWYCFCMLNRYQLVHKVCCTLFHLFPALIIDLFAKLTGKRTGYYRGYGKLHKLLNVTSYFTTRNWIIEMGNTRRLWRSLSQKDKEMFNFNLEGLNWMDYCEDHIRGIRVYMLRDSMDNVEVARKRRTRFQICHYTLIGAISVFFAFFMKKICNYLF